MQKLYRSLLCANLLAGLHGRQIEVQREQATVLVTDRAVALRLGHRFTRHSGRRLFLNCARSFKTKRERRYQLVAELLQLEHADGLAHPVFKNLEIFFFEIGDRVAGSVARRYVDDDQLAFDLERRLLAQ